MRGLQKSKRVSWASDVNLCQVRLFLSDDFPSQVGSGAQDNLQAKTSWLSPPTGTGSDDNLPPGFEGTHPTNLLKNRFSQIPIIEWRCPPRFVLDFAWQVVAGEESKEVEIQNQREMRVLEAVYPRPSAIPANPAVMGIEDYPHNDLNTPPIPITPIEEEDATTDTSIEPVRQSTIPMSSQASLAQGMPPSSLSSTSNFPNSSINGNADVAPGLDPEVAAAAFTALSAIMTSNGQGNLIDQELLIKILSDPKFVEKLIADRNAASNQQVLPMPRPAGVILSEPPLAQISRMEPSLPPLSAPPSGSFYHPPNRVSPVPNLRPPQPEAIPAPSPPVGVQKDINYYKSLIQQHGGERQENPPHFSTRHNHPIGANPESANIPKPRDSKPKIMKPCIYYNSSRGCRHGANCAYQHDSSSQQRPSNVPEMASSKRMKLDREITGS